MDLEAAKTKVVSSPQRTLVVGWHCGRSQIWRRFLADHDPENLAPDWRALRTLEEAAVWGSGARAPSGLSRGAARPHWLGERRIARVSGSADAQLERAVDDARPAEDERQNHSGMLMIRSTRYVKTSFEWWKFTLGSLLLWALL